MNSKLQCVKKIIVGAELRVRVYTIMTCKHVKGLFNSLSYQVFINGAHNKIYIRFLYTLFILFSIVVLEMVCFYCYNPTDSIIFRIEGIIYVTLSVPGFLAENCLEGIYPTILNQKFTFQFPLIKVAQEKLL